MVRHLLIISAAAAAALFVLEGCQSYTSGLQQGVARTDETVAIGALHNIALAQRSYSVSHDGNYATLAQLSEGGYLDSRFATERPLKDYVLTLTVTPSGYTCAADPSAGRAGRHFFIDSNSGETHVNHTKPASSSDPIIQ